MKQCITLALSIFLIITLSACNRQSEPSSVVEAPLIVESTNTSPQSKPIQQKKAEKSTGKSESSEKENAMTNISITVGDSVFSAKLYDNNAAKALLACLPMTLDMSELNGNEKYYYLPDKFPTDSERVGSISTGDLMLYGSDCLVLFYESFSTSYSYTKLGFIENASGLADVLGRGSVTVVFAAEN